MVSRLGQPAYRAGQLMDWLYGRGVLALEAMSDLPRSFREALAEAGYSAELPRIASRLDAPDETSKFLLALADGEQVETVYIPEGPRRTICLSTQAGCGMGCAFCATGRSGLVRDLSAGEIVGQVLLVQAALGVRITNAVAMGQGEPLANYDATITALRLLGVDHGVGIAARHLAISTCGLPDGIARLAEEKQQWQLTVSLHAASDRLRSQLMPINRRFPLAQLRQACADYCARSGRRLTFAYVLIDGWNDSREAARDLAAYCQGLLVHVNLIPWNPVPGVELAPSKPARLKEFQGWLTAAKVNATIRRARGAEFNAACGQLRADQLEVGP